MSSNPLVKKAGDLERALRDALGDGCAEAGPDVAIDGLLPRFVATPRSVDELAAALRAANERGAAVIPWGGGRHIALGNAPGRYDVALRTRKLDRVIEHEPADMTVCVQAGLTFARLQSLLVEHGQFLPIDAPGGATVGGALAAGVSGPSRHAYGLPRDWLLGCRIVLADGTIVKGGGKVVKNVAGYDLPKLAVGSLGTLGVTVEATFKVAPLPATQETLLISYPTLEAAAKAIFEADGLALRAATLSNAPGADVPAMATFWVAGTDAAVERTSRELRAGVPAEDVTRLEGERSTHSWTALAESKHAEDDDVIIRASLPPSQVVEFINGLPSGASVTNAYPTAGVVLVMLNGSDPAWLRDTIVSARRLATRAGGSLVVTQAPAEVKSQVDVWGESEARPLMRRLKEQFDPRSTLNPGRFVGGI